MLVRAKRGNPVGVRTLWVRSADREESSIPGREQDDQKAKAGSGNATGTHDEQIGTLLLMVVDQPAGYRPWWPGAKAR